MENALSQELSAAPEAVVPTLDGISYKAAEVDRLQAEVPLCTEVGEKALLRALLFGKQDAETIRANQAAVQELLGNDELRESLGDVLAVFGESEADIDAFRDGRCSLPSYKKFRAGIRSLRLFESVPLPQEQYNSGIALLQSATSDVHQLDESDLASRLRGPVYYTPHGLRSREELPWYDMARLRFRPWISGRVAALVIGGVAAAHYGHLTQTEMDAMGDVIAIPALVSVLSVMPTASRWTMKDQFWNVPTVYNRLDRQIQESPVWRAGMRAIGHLDMLHGLSQLHRLFEANGHQVVFPNIEETDAYHFRAEDLKNPLFALEAGRVLVANSLEIGDEQRLTFLSGPNSGGKSTISKAVVMNQALAQAGSSVVASSASLTPADHIAYHIPTAPDLEDGTGRFGFEAARVKEVLHKVTPRSLTILDDCLDGTTHEERLAVLKDVMQAFRAIGGATLFSTHAHELLAEFEKQGVGQFRQVTFENDAPTYQIEPGVSHTSHAAKVAAQHGLGRTQLWDLIRERTGVEPTNWF